MSITRREAQGPFGGSARALSIFLGVDHTTVAHWDADTPIPPFHQWRLAMALPHYFPAERIAFCRSNSECLQAAQAYMDRNGLKPTPPPDAHAGHDTEAPCATTDDEPSNESHT